MKYYLITIKSDSQSIIAHDTQEAALSAFHSEMAYAYNARIDTTCVVTDTYGSQLKKERYAVPVPVTETPDEKRGGVGEYVNRIIGSRFSE